MTSRRLAMVTGANGGIGSAIAERLFMDGYSVAMVVHRNRETAGALAHRLGGPNEDVLIVRCDLSDPGQARSLMTCESLADRQLAVLVNNHGVMYKAPLLEISENDYDAVMNVNLRSTYFLTQAAARRMVTTGGGSIVNIASASVTLPSLNLGAYTLSKAGMLMLTRVAAQELGVHNIRVNAVSPGLVPTAISEQAYRDPEVVAARRNSLAVDRFGDPRDVANAVAFLVSDQAAYVTGQNLLLDGGSHDNFLKPMRTEVAVREMDSGR